MLPKGRITAYEELAKQAPQAIDKFTFSAKFILKWKLDWTAKESEDLSISQSGLVDETFTLQTRVYRLHTGLASMDSIVVAPSLDTPSSLLDFYGRESRSDLGAAVATHFEPPGGKAGIAGTISRARDRFSVLAGPGSWTLVGRYKDGTSAYIIPGGSLASQEVFNFNGLSLKDLDNGKFIIRDISYTSPAGSVKGTVEFSLVCHILNGMSEGRDYKIKDVMPPANAKNPIAVTDPSGEISILRSWWDHASLPMRSATVAHEAAHTRQFQHNWPTTNRWDRFFMEYDAWKTEADYLKGFYMFDPDSSPQVHDDELDAVLEAPDLIYKNDSSPVPPGTVMERMITEKGYAF
jgi:hypothetical protein